MPINLKLQHSPRRWLTGISLSSLPGGGKFQPAWVGWEIWTGGIHEEFKGRESAFVGKYLRRNFPHRRMVLTYETNKWHHKLCLILQNLMITQRPFVMLGWGIWTHFLHGVRQFEWANCQKFKCPGGMLKIRIYRCVSASGQNIFRRLKSFAYLCSNLSSTHCDISLDFLAFIWFACPWRVPIV